MKRILFSLALLAASGAANAGLSWSELSTANRTEVFNVSGITPDGGPNLGTTVSRGTLITDTLGTITFTYLGQESGYNNVFHLTINGSNLLESNPVGTSISATVSSPGAIGFSFEGNTGNFANNGGSWASGTSIGLIGTNMTVGSAAGGGTYAFVLGYNDSAGTRYLGDWDDMVIGANFAAAVPEPEVYAMMLAGLGLMGFVARRRKQQVAG